MTVDSLRSNHARVFVTVCFRFREAELKHGRLAMVALAGWLVATLLLALLTGVRVRNLDPIEGCSCSIYNLLYMSACGR